jgi:hypothetical protein
MRMNHKTTLGHQGFAAKTLPELDALAEPTGADA